MELEGPTQNLGSLKYLQWPISGATSDLAACDHRDRDRREEVDIERYFGRKATGTALWRSTGFFRGTHENQPL